MYFAKQVRITLELFCPVRAVFLADFDGESLIDRLCINDRRRMNGLPFWGVQIQSMD